MGDLKKHKNGKTKAGKQQYRLNTETVTKTGKLVIKSRSLIGNEPLRRTPEEQFENGRHISSHLGHDLNKAAKEYNISIKTARRWLKLYIKIAKKT